MIINYDVHVSCNLKKEEKKENLESEAKLAPSHDPLFLNSTHTRTPLPALDSVTVN